MPALSNRILTSDEAARAIEPRRPRLWFLVLRTLHERGETGATAQELEQATGLAGNTIRPRLVELCAANLVERTHRRRPTRSGRDAFVYVALPWHGDRR